MELTSISPALSTSPSHKGSYTIIGIGAAVALGSLFVAVVTMTSLHDKLGAFSAFLYKNGTLAVAGSVIGVVSGVGIMYLGIKNREVDKEMISLKRQLKKTEDVEPEARWLLDDQPKSVTIRDLSIKNHPFDASEWTDFCSRRMVQRFKFDKEGMQISQKLPPANRTLFPEKFELAHRNNCTIELSNSVDFVEVATDKNHLYVHMNDPGSGKLSKFHIYAGEEEIKSPQVWYSPPTHSIEIIWT